MKRAAKVLLIIAILLVIILLGYMAYEHFKAPEMEQIDSAEGASMYSSALSASLDEEEYSVFYESSTKAGKEKTSIKGYMTIDDYGFYQRWEGDQSGNLFIVDMGSNYGVFSQEGDKKSFATMSVSDFENASKIYSDDYLGFLKSSNKEANEKHILSLFYSNSNPKEGKFVNAYGVENGQYVWKITYTCKYEEEDKQYTSTLVRKVYFDDEAIRSVSYDKQDKELNNKGKVKWFGATKKIEMNYDIEYKTNKLVVETDFSGYSGS